MTLTNEELNKTIYYLDYCECTSENSIENYKIVEDSYRNYLRDFGGDETTTPRGVAPRMHIREEEEECICGGIDKNCWKCDGTGIIKGFQIWSWGASGNHPYFVGTKFDTEEEAELEIYDYYRNYVENHNDNAPIWFDTFESALQDIAEVLDLKFEVVQSLWHHKQLRDELKKKRSENMKKNIEQQKTEDKKLVDSLIASIVFNEGESYQTTCNHLEAVLPRRIAGSVFHKAVKEIRNKK